MSDDILDLIKGGPGNHRIVARRAGRVFDDSDRFVVKASGAGPFIGKRGGKWADSKHTIPWKEGRHASRQKRHAHAGGSPSKFNAMHSETDEEGHKDLQHRHFMHAVDARRDARSVRPDSNAAYRHREAARYHDRMAIVHGHAASIKGASWGKPDPHDVKSLKEHLKGAHQSHQNVQDMDAGAARYTPPTSTGGRSSGTDQAHSMGRTGSGKPMHFLSDRNFRDSTHGMSKEDHQHHAAEHTARATHHDRGYTQSQREGDYAQAAKHKRASDYHREMSASHDAAHNGSNRAVRASMEDADHAAKMAAPGSMAGPFKKSEPFGRTFNPLDLVKAGGKPPAGFHPIPGGKHNGYTNGKTGRLRRYWYPHDVDISGASKHHREQAERIQREHRYRMTPSGYPKDKAAKKELEHHWHAHYALNDGDFRIGAAPKKKKAPAKKRAPAKRRQSAKKPAATAKKRTRAAIAGELRAAKDGHVVYGVDKRGKKVVYATKEGSRWKDADGLRTTSAALQSMISQRDGDPAMRLEIGSKRARVKKPAAAPAKKRQSAAKKKTESKTHKVSAVSTGRYRSGGETITEFTIDDPTSPGGKRFHKYEGRGKTAAVRKKHAMKQHAERHGIEKPIQHSADPTGERKAAEKKRGVGSAKDRKKGPAAGKHRISIGRGKHEEVDTHHAHGLYALHETTSDNEKKMAKLRGRKVKREFGVTHTPSGLSLGRGSERAMKKLARHMHDTAGDAGAAAKFGHTPSTEEYKRMQSAYLAHKK